MQNCVGDSVGQLRLSASWEDEEADVGHPEQWEQNRCRLHRFPFGRNRFCWMFLWPAQIQGEHMLSFSIGPDKSVLQNVSRISDDAEHRFNLYPGPAG